MPSGPSKVDSKCLSMCARVEPFTSLGTCKKELKIPAYFWEELASDPEAVSNFLVCLVARLISLDSAHGMDALVSVYRDLVELSVDYTKYKAWANKPLPNNTRPTALELQQSIVSTIYFLTEFYSYRPTIHLRHIYLRWNLARNYTGGDGSGKIADTFEEKVISPFSVPHSKEVIIHPPRTQLLIGRTITGSPVDKEKLVSRIINQCCQNHRRANFGVVPPEVSKLCIYSTVNEAMAYIALQQLMISSFHSGAPAIKYLLSALATVAAHGQSIEQGDREDLLSLLQLLKDFVTMLLPVDWAEAYRAVMPFYMWPVAHAECSQRILSLLAQEGKVQGTSFRRKLLVENNLGLKLKNTEIRGQFVHMLVDVSNPRTHGNQFSMVFANRQDLHSVESLHRMIIRSCFKSVFPVHDLVELESHLQRLSPKSLVSVCCECVEVMEGGMTRGNGDQGDEIRDEMATEINKLHKRIIHETDAMDEQRDSAVSCSSNGGIEEDAHHTTEETLGIFALPSPNIPTHSLPSCKYTAILDKLRDVLVQCHKQLSSVVTQQRTLSRTSMDSTGSSHMDTESRTPNTGEAGGLRILSTGGPVKLNISSHSPERSAEGSKGSDLEEKEEDESCDNHAASPDSGHVMSPDPVLVPFTHPPVLVHENVKKSRSLSTEISPPVFHTPEQNGDTHTSPDEVFNGHNGSVIERSNTRLIRRKTFPAKCRPTSTIDTTSSSSFTSSKIRTSIISHAPTYNTLRKEYTNVAGTPQIPSSALPVGSRLLSTRKGSISLPKRRMLPLSGAGSPVHAYMPKICVLKIVLAGGDLLVCHTAKAYMQLLSEEPNLFNGLDIRFYHVPLSMATGADWQTSERIPNSTGNGDGPETIVGYQLNTCGLDVNIGRYMSHLDSWYERNVALAIHHSLRLLPPCHSDVDSCDTSSPPLVSQDFPTRPPVKPSKILIDSVAHYLREANHCIKAKMYKIKMIIKPEKLHKMEHREMYMLYRLDIQRLTGKRNKWQAKPFEANLQLSELSLDGSFAKAEVTPVKEVWSVRVSNIPRATDPTVANPESECFELSVVTAYTEGGRFTKSRLTEQAHYHTHDLTIETKKEPLAVMIDGDGDSVIDNVIRLEISSVNNGSSGLQRSNTPSHNSPAVGVKGDRTDYFPLMTFWPVDL